ncbi:unnamed protein product [Durusdinium trenchii]|uniref:RCC1-like domain-containing protein n=1 Tax=Durusdinium trenchii TaxID=1381693 RepID=A0ABP0IER0_9DINO
MEGQISSEDHFTQFTYTSPPQKIACGINHSICVSNLSTPSSYITDHTAPPVFGWGRNVYNICGFGEQVHQASIPTRIECHDFAKGSGIYEVSCGNNHSLFLRKHRHSPGGDVLGLGLGNRGRQGSPNPNADDDDTPEVEDIWFVESPTKVPITDVPIARVVCGADHSLALDLNGILYAWGMNNDGQCGVGRRSDVLVPERVVLPQQKSGQVLVAHMAGGGRHSMLVTAKDGSMGSTSGGKVYVWGCNSDGRLGLGHDRNELVPVLVESVQNTKMSLVAAGEVHSGAVDVKGSLYMWGLGAYGRLGLGEVMDVPLPRRIQIPDEAPVSQLALGIFHSVALAGNRIQSVYTWGYGEALGNQVGGGISLSPRVVSFGDDTKTQVLQIAAGPYHTLVLMENGELMTFGSGASGRLGTGNSKNHKLPVSLGSHGFATKLKQVSEEGEKVVRMPSGRLVKSIGCGRDHCIAVTYDGNAYAWGKGDKGQLGVGRNEDTATPKAVHIHNVLSCAAGEDHSGAICRGEEDNELWMWGATELGKLGLGEAQLTSADSVPVAIRSLAKSENSYKVPISLSCGQYHTAVICAREKDDESDRVAGRVWTFGAGWFGRLGHNNMENQYEPKMVSSLVTSIQSVHCGAYHTCALSYERGMMNDNGELTGDLWVWGRNRCICEHEHAKVPTKFMQIDGQPKVTCVATSDMTTMLVTAAGLVYAWGGQPPWSDRLGRWEEGVASARDHPESPTAPNLDVGRASAHGGLRQEQGHDGMGQPELWTPRIAGEADGEGDLQTLPGACRMGLH